jgi:hypothetical protein
MNDVIYSGTIPGHRVWKVPNEKGLLLFFENVQILPNSDLQLDEEFIEAEVTSNLESTADEKLMNRNKKECAFGWIEGDFADTNVEFGNIYLNELGWFSNHKDILIDYFRTSVMKYNKEVEKLIFGKK